MLTLKACSSGWTPARDAYNGLANFPVSQTFVREHFCNYCATRNFNRLSCRCTPVTSVNDGASCGFAIFRRVARKWPDQSIQARLIGFSPAIDRSPLGRFSGVEAVQRTVRQFLLVDEPPDLRVEI